MMNNATAIISTAGIIVRHAISMKFESNDTITTHSLNRMISVR